MSISIEEKLNSFEIKFAASEARVEAKMDHFVEILSEIKKKNRQLDGAQRQSKGPRQKARSFGVQSCFLASGVVIGVIMSGWVHYSCDYEDVIVWKIDNNQCHATRFEGSNILFKTKDDCILYLVDKNG